MDDELNYIELAAIIGVTPPSIGYWERDIYSMEIHHYSKVIAYLGYDPLYDDSGTLVAKIENYRRKHGLTLTQFANMVGLDYTTISAIVRGKRTEIFLSTEKRILKVIESSD